METTTTRKFRIVTFKSEPAIPIISGRTGKPVTIKLKQLNNFQKEILTNVFDFIEGKVKGTPLELPIQSLLGLTGFLVTSSNHLGAYSVSMDDAPLVIFNSKTITDSADELAVSVLHELLHFITEPGDGDPASMEEACHDLCCYNLLGVPGLRITGH